jgi:formate-dependent nitrite reductase membrane component NrfD
MVRIFSFQGSEGKWRTLFGPLYVIYLRKAKNSGVYTKNFEIICFVLVVNGKILLFWDNVFSKSAMYDSMIRIRFDCPEWMCGGNMVKAVFLMWTGHWFLILIMQFQRVQEYH